MQRAGIFNRIRIIRCCAYKSFHSSSQQKLGCPNSYKPPSSSSNPRQKNNNLFFLNSTRLSNFASMAGSAAHSSVHDFTVKDIKGKDVDLGIFKDKILLIVNVASECRLTTSNYTELNELYHKYKNKGLEILAFPCNQFGGQEPGNNDQIVELACTRFKAEFPIFNKIDVNGPNAAPIYKFLKSSKGGIFGDDIKWNFTKFLIDRDGNVVKRYAPTTSPSSIENDLKQLLEVS